MKKILFLLLFTIASYGQAVFDEGIQITNTESTTATKVNVQEANGKVNTKTINTAFNKNFGLNTGDVVGATTLLNQYSTTPVDWTATAFNSGKVVFYGGKQWIAKIATVAGDVPAVSSKWEEITFEALANKTTTVDQTIIDGSTNAVSGNAVFDGLAVKAPIVHTHTVSQITDFPTFKTIEGQPLIGAGNIDLDKNSVGLGNVDNTSDLSKPLSTATQTALNGKENSFTKNTAFNKNFGTTAGTVAEGNDSRINNGQTAFSWGNHVNGGYAFTTGSNINQSSFRTALGLGSNAYTSTAFLPLSGGDLSGSLTINSTFFRYRASGIDAALISSSKNIDGGSSTDFNTYVYGNDPYGIWTNGVKRVSVGGDGNTTFTGTVTALPATTANQVVVKSQLDAVAARPYKVYTAVLTQQNTNAPTATVLENTLGGTVVWTRNSTGNYYGTLNSAFPIQSKIALFQGGSMWGILPLKIIRVQHLDSNTIQIFTQQATDGALVDSSLSGTSIEIRVYN